jgi:predicted transposase/invertase (TIGR01784 family)
VKKLSKDLQNVYRTLEPICELIEAELMQDAIERGINQGKERVSLEISLELLRMGMAPEEVARITQLSIEQVLLMRNLPYHN